jgi:serine/threonine protein kinase
MYKVPLPVTKQIYNALLVLEQIGKGSFGEVYCGIWNETTRVALKKLHEKSQFESFIKEATILQ